MTKTIAELRAERATAPDRRATRTMTVCLAPHLLTEVRKLGSENDEIALSLPSLTAPEEEDGDGRPRRAGGADPETKKARNEAIARMAEIRDRLGEVLAEMGEYEGELTVRANLTDGEWRRWTNENPSRSEGEPGYERDQRVTLGYCNADALIDHIGAFVHLWNAEPVTAADWTEVLDPDVGSADKADIATRVIELYESRLDFQRLRNGLSANLKRLSVSSSPVNSGSATSDSTAGSPSGSTADTTSTATK